MWKVRMYMNTGFNSLNVPDSEATLNTAADSYTDFDAIDCLQRYFLDTITIRAFEDQIIHGDYLKIWDTNNTNRYAFYSITGYNMTSGDTIQLGVVMDPLLTCGGVDNIDFLDGVTNRYNASNNKIDARNVEDDPMLIPRNIHLMCLGEYFGDEYDSYSPGGIYIGGSNNLMVASMYPIFTPDKLKIKSAVSVVETQGTYEGTIASKPIISVDGGWPTGMGEGESTPVTVNYGDTMTNSLYTTDGNYYWNVPSLQSSGIGTYGNLLRACRKLIEYGRSDVISAAYFVPAKLTKQGRSVQWPDESNKSRPLNGIYICKMLDPEGFNSAYFVYSVTNKDALRKDLTSFYTGVGYTVKNKRALMGKNFNFTFALRDSGKTVEVDPQQLQYKTYNGDKIPEIRVSVDLRPSGHVEYGICTEQDASWTRPPHIILKGATWEQANLAAMAASGVALNAEKYELNQKLKEEQLSVNLSYGVTEGAYGYQGYFPHNAFSAGNKAAMLEDALTSRQRAFGSEYGADYIMGNAAFLMSGDAAAGNPFSKMYFDRDVERMQEKQEFINANYSNPQVIISGGGGCTLETGHGMLLYRSLPSEDDVKRFDRILNQFGVKITVPINKNQLKCRTLYNYIEASSVSVKCDSVPKAVRNDLGSLLSHGLRIWHTDPKDHNYTEENAWVSGIIDQ